ncbi:GRM5-like protein [Mya arenaria]|uniref:GRM5-like protein n=1 Tax=Mya arenaria TaxID=6604 RepID=A0ABY7ECT8_MYAAR|nr:GRM5-like protein [Mya arenaria]
MHMKGNYGERGIEVFKNLARTKNVCIAEAAAAPSVDADQDYDMIISNFLATARANVIVCFCEGRAARRLMMAMKRNPRARGKYQILASDGWADRPDVVLGVEDVAVGAITMKLRANRIAAFDTYMLALRPENYHRNPWFPEFWQWKFNCRLTSLPPEEQDMTQPINCTGKEELENVVQDAKLGFVIKAIYALAHALHNMHGHVCGPNSGLCDNMAPLDGAMLLDFLHNVSFTYESEEVFFDANGDPPPRYYIVNYRKVLNWSGNVTYKYEVIGKWNSGKLDMDDRMIYWPQHYHGNVPRSTCADECAKGHVKTLHGVSQCCWVCQKCPDNAIIVDSETCGACEQGWWPNKNLTECARIPIEYITWWDTEAMVALITACFGIFVTLWIGIVFLRHNNTPVVKASTRELMYIILIGVMMAFCSNFVLVARPNLVTCYFTRILPGLSFSLIYGSLVTKTNRIARILEGTKKIITKKPRFMSASAQVIITCIIIGVECAIITIMLVIEPADSKLDYPEPRRVKLICNTTTMGIIVPLGFDLVLIAMCTLYAIKTRNLPENFNEAKFIGFSMYTTCVIWLGFMAIYFGSERKVITMSVSVSLSAYVALVLLFFPKAYIIIWAPEKNTRSAFTTSKDVRCHIGSISCASGESIDLIRDVRHRDGMKVSGSRRRAGFFNKLRYGGTGQHTRHLYTYQSPRMKTDVGSRLKRDNSFHVSAGIAKQCGTFSWAKMSAAMTSEEDRLSPISSKGESEEVKRKYSYCQKKDAICQTDAELLDSIMNMPYLTRKKSQRIQRTAAIDEDYASVKFSPNSSMKVRFHKRIASEPNHLEFRRRNVSGSGKQAARTESRTFLFPGYSDSPISTSDDIENEEDFEYYDSISDLLKAHKITPNYVSDNVPVCLNDKSMSTYLNPLGNRGNNTSLESDPDNKTSSAECRSLDSDTAPTEPVQVLVENHVNGHVSMAVTSADDNETFQRTLATFEGRPGIETNSLASPRDLNHRHSVCTEVPKLISNSNSISVLPRRSSSPMFSHISSHSLNFTVADHNNEAPRRRKSSALSAGSPSSVVSERSMWSPSGESLPQTSFAEVYKPPNTEVEHDGCASNFVNACKNEEKSMLEFQSFLRERGVELDLTFIESSEV